MNQQNSIPTARSYQPGTCYMCQSCLTCSKNLDVNTYDCNITEKPKSLNKKRNFFGRIYNAKNKEKLVQCQIDELKRCNEYFGYSSDFDGYFKIFLCIQCHSKFTRLKKKTKKNPHLNKHLNQLKIPHHLLQFQHHLQPHPQFYL